VIDWLNLGMDVRNYERSVTFFIFGFDDVKTINKYE